MSSAESVRVRAPGKINVFLEVGDVKDDGYHDVATAYQAVSLYEEMTATAADDFTLEVSARGPVDIDGVPTDDRNLAVRAARLLAETAGIDRGVHLSIVKAVPVAGGMGGGSADAAAALVACDALWGLGMPTSELVRLAAQLGADVPFALLGGTAVGTGRGDELSPALARGRFDWVLVPNEIGMSTPVVYGELDAHRERHAVDIGPAPRVPAVAPEILHALRQGDGRNARRLAAQRPAGARPPSPPRPRSGARARRELWSPRRPRVRVGADARVPRGRRGVGDRSAGHVERRRARRVARPRACRRRPRPLTDPHPRPARHTGQCSFCAASARLASREVVNPPLGAVPAGHHERGSP
ncbi:4-diphosphocytidyl-2C-methyl-D-erythritol kinase [Microbacterium sp. SORGH_AS 969]|nr:4-diphosphocytidyl-2C-methyl-D-erythritol kinase [Microbacterium sp. SORGH_AS_0969]